MAWEVAGLSRICKILRERFDSAPRLQILYPKRLGMIGTTDVRRLSELVLEHHAARVAAETKLMNLREKHVRLSKELSALKRTKPLEPRS